MTKIVYYCLFLLLFVTASCDADDDFVLPSDENTSEESQNVEVHGDYHVLVIGNSFSRDACSYVPSIIRDLCPYVYLDFNIYYRGGVGLNSHWNSISQNKADHTWDYFNVLTNKWEATTDIVGKDLITSKNWDLVVLQEGNITCWSYDDTSAIVKTISDYIHSLQPGCLIAYLMVPAPREGHNLLGNLTSDDALGVFVSTASQLEENHDVDYVLPCGTAIQNARHTHLDNLGDFGHLTYDGTHLQEGLPCLIDAYTVTQSLFDILGIDATIEKSGLHIDQQWVNSKNIPGKHGKVIEGSESDYSVCKKCALAAVEEPYAISFVQ